MSRKQTWAVGGLGLVTFTSLVGASSGVTGTGGITGRATITSPGTYTVTQNVDLSGTNLGAGTPAILIMLSGGQTVLDLDGHSVKRGPGAPVIEMICTGGGEVTVRDGKVESGSENIKSTGCNVRLERIRAVNAAGDGVHVTGGSIDVRHSVIRNPGGNGIWGDSSTCGVDDSVIASAGEEGLAFHTLERVTVARTTIRGAAECGVDMDIADLTGPSAGVSFTDVRILGLEGTPDIEEMMDGYHFNGRIPVTITGGVVRGASRYGMYFGDNNQAVSVSGAAITGVSGPAAMQFVGQRGPVNVTGSHLRGFAGDGIVAEPGATTDNLSAMRFEGNVLISGAIGEGASDVSAFRMDDASTLRIVGNSVEAGNGIRSTSDGAVIADNVVRIKEGWTDVDVIAIDVGGRGAVVRNNIVAGQGVGTGILVQEDGVGQLLSRNRVRGFATGLHFAPGTTVDAQGYFRGNTLTGNTTAFSGGVDAGGNIF